MKKTLLLLAITSFAFISCNNDDDETTPSTTVAPTTYTFERNGTTSISFSGQTTRIQMSEEIIVAMKDPSFNEAQIDAMYAHTAGANNFTNTALNASDKSGKR